MIKRYFTVLCLTAGLALAQRYQGPLGPPRGEVFERAQVDLSRAAERSYDRRRIEHARREIGEFQRKLAFGHFSGRDLDRAIGATDDVVRRSALPPQDRDILFRDVEGMRAFRAYAR